MQTIGTASEATMQNIRIQLGQRVRDIRKEMGWSQEELGERADLHPTYIGGIERGERNVALENLNKVASAFKFSLAELLDFPTGSQTGKKAIESRILILLRGQSAKSLKFILRFLETFDEWMSKGK